MVHDYQTDIDAIHGVAAVPTILDVICRTTHMGFAAIARVTDDRWVALCVRDEIAFGLVPGGELQLESTICHEIRQSGEPVVINHVAESPVWRDHHTPAQYGFQSYISMPIVLRDGSFFGTLCAIDPKPADLDRPEVIGMFRMFADLIAFHLEASEKLALSEARMLDQQKSAELREQFIAVLGHDLRNPLAAIVSGLRLLGKSVVEERPRSIIAMMQDSAQRMTGLIDDVLDFARGRLGGGFVLHRDREEIAPLLEQVVAELRATNPGRAIVLQVPGALPLACDRARFSQMFSNLLGNALSHGSQDRPVEVAAIARDGWFELSIANDGPEIPLAIRPFLFQPFSRGAKAPHHQGLGLGLYIAAEIARAHGGTLSVESTQDKTQFTFRMKLS